MPCAVRSPLFLALATLAILLVALEAARPCFFLHDDNATWFAGAYAHDFRVLTETGRIAEINFYQYGGEPFLEQGQTAVLYPPVYLGAALAALIPGDLRWTIEWLAALHLALGVAGFYCWLRQGGVDATLAALGGLAWALNPFVLILGASWITVTYAVAWLPWLFWAIDRVFARPSPRAALTLGAILGLFVLQGYVQWAAYAMLFAGMYVLFLTWATELRGQVRSQTPAEGSKFGNEEAAAPAPGGRRLPLLIALCIAGLLALALAAPLLLPMFRAVAESAARAQPLSIEQELFYRVQPGDLLGAQFGFFRHNFLFDASTVLLFCPALLLLPLALARFIRGDADLRRRLFALVLPAAIALVLSSRGYFLLNIVPLLQHFRWPFKIFLFAEFFLLAAFVWSLASIKGGPARGARGLLIVVLLLQLAVALAHHDSDFLSQATLPALGNPLPAGMDPTLGRVVAIDDQVPVTDAYRYFTHAYGTYFQTPSLGGYDPLVSRQRLAFALGLDVPNLFREKITPEVRAELESRAVRYWVVDPNALPLVQGSSGSGAFGGLGGFRLLSTDRDRLVLEDMRAAPMAFDTLAPNVSLPIRYVGNSLFIGLNHSSLVAVSLGPTNGWWYRIDGGSWRRPDYRDARVYIPVSQNDRELEVSYFDPWLRDGLCKALMLFVLIAVVASAFGLGFLRLRRRDLPRGALTFGSSETF